MSLSLAKHFLCSICDNHVYLLCLDYVPALEGRAVVSLQMGNLFGSLLDITAAIKVHQLHLNIFCISVLYVQLSPSAELYTNRGVIHQVSGSVCREWECTCKKDSVLTYVYLMCHLYEIYHLHFHVYNSSWVKELML